MSEDVAERPAPTDFRDAAEAGRAAFRHEAMVFATAAEFLDGAVPFLRAAVEVGEPALAVTTPARIDLLARALDGHADAVEFVDANDWYRVPAWTLGAYHHYVARRGGERRVRILGEPVWSERTEDQVVEWHRYESIINVAMAGSNASILCPYDAEMLAPTIIDTVGKTHPALFQGAGSVHSADYLEPISYTAAHQVGVAPAPPGALEVAFDLSRLAAVRRTAAAWGAAQGLSENGVRELLIAVHEVASNAVEHGGGRGMARFWATPDDVICEVVSPGRLRIPLPGYLPPDVRQERGRGLWMARQVCSRVDITSGDAGALVRLALSRRATKG